MDFRILGSLEVWDGERQLELGGPKRRAVLAFLLLHPNEVVGADRLVDQLWGARAPRNAAAALHTHVSRLRKELGPDVVARRAWGYVLRTEPGALDLERFEQVVAEGEQLAAGERARKLREALALWRGPPLEDLAFEPGLAKDIARLEELRLTVLENRIDADLEAGNHKGLVSELETLIAQNPLRERLRGQLILTLYRSGRQAEALEVYRETRRLLADELGLEPSPELRELERAILRHDPALRPAPFSDLEAAPVPDVRPGGRRWIYVGASVAALLVALGAAAFTLDRRGADVSHGSSLPPTTSAGHVNRRARPPSHRHDVARHTKAARATTTGARKAQPTETTRTVRTRPTHRARTGMTARRKPKPKPTPKPKPVRIADTFSDPTLDPLIWSSWSNGTGTSSTQEDGQLVFSIAGDVSFDPKFHGAASNIGTQCRSPATSTPASTSRSCSGRQQTAPRSRSSRTGPHRSSSSSV